MHRTLTLCRAGLAGVAAVVLLTACGGGESTGSAASSSAAPTSSSSAGGGAGEAASGQFCTEAKDLMAKVQASFAGESDPARLVQAFPRIAGQLRAIEPPQEIATDWSTFADSLDRLGRAAQGVDLNDPQQAAKFQADTGQLQQDLTASSTKVESYLRNQCGIDTGGTGS